MKTGPATLISLLLLPVLASAQSSVQLTIPSGTPLPVRLGDHVPMKAGESIRAGLLYPVYVDGKLVLPAGTTLTGHVESLAPDRSRRLHARLRADFTPFHTPVVRFDGIQPPAGPAIPITTTTATDGAPIYRVVRTPAPKGGIVGQYFAFGVQHVKDTVYGITGPEKGDRLLQFLYSQLPYHPERIARATAWTVETSAPVTLSSAVDAPQPPAPVRRSRINAFLTARPAPAPTAPDAHSGWILQAYLDDPISSESSHATQTIHATVAEPILDADGSVAVPQGSVLSGTVTLARPARRFARAGVLRFNFSELKFPGGEAQTVRTTLTGADSASAGQLALDSEGQAKPKAQDKVFTPALLIILASQPFDRGHHGEGEHMAGKDAAASSGLGLISLIVGTAAQQPNFAIGIGYYSAALSIYPRYFGKGATVAFPKDTRIVLQTTPTRGAALKPDAKP